MDRSSCMLPAVDASFAASRVTGSFAAEAAARGFARHVLADTAAGPLAVWEQAAPGPMVYVSAGIHGDEPAGPLAMLELLRGGFFRPGIHWRLAPALNPTGLAAAARESACGTDLNRDYLLRRSREVAAHAAWLAAGPTPSLFLSLHEDWEASGFYFYEINTGADTPHRARRILSAVEPWFAAEAGDTIDGHTPRAPGWIFHEAEADVPDGWPEAIYLAKLGCPLSFTFETPSRAGLAERVAALCAATRSAFDA